MRSSLPLVGLLILQPLFADKISLKNGESFEGDFFGATSQEIRFVVDGKLRNFSTSEVTMIQFGEGSPATPAAAPADPKPARQPPATPAPPETAPSAPRAAQPAEPAAPRTASTAESKRSGADRPTIRRRETDTTGAEPASRPEPVETASRTDEDEDAPPELPDNFTLPRGTVLDVRLNESIDSIMNNSGQTFDAELIRPIVVRGQVMAPEGTSVVARMLQDREPGYGGNDRDGNDGRDQDYEVIAVDLIAIVIDGARVPIRTNVVSRRIMASKRERAIEGLGRAGRELGTILGGSMGIPTDPTGQPREDTKASGGGAIPRGTILQFRIEDELFGQSPDISDRFSE